MSTDVPYCPPEMHQKFASICEKAPMFDIPPKTASKMKQLMQRVQELEAEVQTMKRQRERDLANMREDYEAKIQLLKQQQQDTHSDLKEALEMVAQQRQRDVQGNDRPRRLRITSCTNTLSIQADSAGGENDLQSIIGQLQRHVVCRDVERNSTEIESVDYCDPEHEENSILGKLHQLRERMEKRHLEAEEHFKKRVQSEMAVHRRIFLRVNSRLTEVVSQSLESLSGCEDNDTVGSVREDLHWLQENLQKCRPARCASWP